MKKRGKEMITRKTVMLRAALHVCATQEAKKDAAIGLDRGALERQLARRQGTGRQHGFRRYLKTISDEHFAIDDKMSEKKLTAFVLRTTRLILICFINAGEWTSPSGEVRNGRRLPWRARSRSSCIECGLIGTTYRWTNAQPTAVQV